MSSSSSPVQPERSLSDASSENGSSQGSSEGSGSLVNDENFAVLAPVVDKHNLERYVHLLNNSIRGGHGSQESFEQSYIDNTLWSASEKQTFFQSLLVHGPRDASNIAKDISTKSVLEVRAYIMVLQSGVEDHQSQGITRSVRGDVAAHDVGMPLDKALEEFSAVVETNLHDQLCAQDQARYGDYWIVDKHHATSIEANLATELEDERSTSATTKIDSFQLLHQGVFVELMWNVFMNSDNSTHWENLDIRTPGSDGPSLLRSAFEDFYQIVLSLTKRLVQAALIQATSRLRADREARIVPTVRAIDILTILDVLNMRPSLHPHFWLSSVRCIKVLSRSKKLRAGKLTMPRNGFVLTAKELKRRLGQRLTSISDAIPAESADASDSIKVSSGEEPDDDADSSADDESWHASDDEVDGTESKLDDDHERLMHDHDDKQSFRAEAELRDLFDLSPAPFVTGRPLQHRPAKRRRAHNESGRPGQARGLEETCKMEGQAKRRRRYLSVSEVSSQEDE